MDSNAITAEGLTDIVRIGPESYFGHDPRWMVDASAVTTHVVPDSKLKLFPIDEVFTDPDAIFLGVGNPNVYLTVPNENGTGWVKFAAFMFRRRESYIADTKGRVQSGLLFQLLDLPENAKFELRQAMKKFSDTKSPSCTYLNCQVLMEAGFTSGGHSLDKIYRSTRLARRIWREGLEWNGYPVNIRVIRTVPSTVEHITKAWRKEVTSGCRTVKRKFAHLRGKDNDVAPILEARRLSPSALDQLAEGSTRRVRVGIGVPSWIGARLSNRYGEQPMYIANPDLPMDELKGFGSLKPYPGQLDICRKALIGPRDSSRGPSSFLELILNEYH